MKNSILALLVSFCLFGCASFEKGYTWKNKLQLKNDNFSMLPGKYAMSPSYAFNKKGKSVSIDSLEKKETNIYSKF
jgi:hypothetical protein